ncbi:hypothetical protein HRbin15_02317 [bacterium HR15]|nr:hypothetical protein HRbin15_02317 [bacterium HR15]
MRLTQLRTGDTARIVRIIHDADGHWRKLTALGITPGATVRLVQKLPTCVLQIGYSMIALDHLLASQIEVEPIPANSE